MVDQTNDVEPRAVTTIGLLSTPVGYEMFDPNNAATQPQQVIGWLINENNGVHVTLPITTSGDPPAGWKLRYKVEEWRPPGTQQQEQESA